MLIRGTRDPTSFVTSAFIVKVDSQRQPDQGAAAPCELGPYISRPPTLHRLATSQSWPPPTYPIPLPWFVVIPEFRHLVHRVV